MLTVMVAFELTGKRSTRKPLGNVYSRMPSTSATFFRLAGMVSAFQPRAGASFGGMGRASCPEAVTAKSKEATAPRRRGDRDRGGDAAKEDPLWQTRAGAARSGYPCGQRTSGRREMRTKGA